MKATQALLADHKLIRKVLEGFHLENPRFPEILTTLRRVVLGHARFEDAVFLPAVEADPLLERFFTAEIYQEHNDIKAFLDLVIKTPRQEKKQMAAQILQLTTLLDTHFKKEEDALFPLAERILDEEGLNRLTEDMRRLPNV